MGIHVYWRAHSLSLSLSQSLSLFPSLLAPFSSPCNVAGGHLQPSLRPRPERFCSRRLLRKSDEGRRDPAISRPAVATSFAFVKLAWKFARREVELGLRAFVCNLSAPKNPSASYSLSLPASSIAIKRSGVYKPRARLPVRPRGAL